ERCLLIATEDEPARARKETVPHREVDGPFVVRQGDQKCFVLDEGQAEVRSGVEVGDENECVVISTPLSQIREQVGCPGSLLSHPLLLLDYWSRLHPRPENVRELIERRNVARAGNRKAADAEITDPFLAR